jgi:hypothetical protein
MESLLKKSALLRLSRREPDDAPRGDRPKPAREIG